ncbi:unnamed protein product [Tetraodon nigroviridis]|uniref:(spotted green pufferfish) hypothetical protein n=1 Tax=Tetraodon nigroviridis TaxID=99883 RepID=Q4RT48_TETNG|nr:unnamed protein product [Tetraodon nigroviridis]
MEDYPILGISSAEDRTQLLRLGQMLKSLNLCTSSILIMFSGRKAPMKKCTKELHILWCSTCSTEAAPPVLPTVRRVQGKTHTMLGSSLEGPGLYALAVRDVFSHLSATKTHPPLLVFVSFFEIYCGQLYDLLNNRKRCWEDGQKVVHISGLHEIRADSVSSLLQVVSHGMAGRTQGMSGVNAHSSRSHAMLQLQLRAPNQQMAGR